MWKNFRLQDRYLLVIFSLCALASGWAGFFSNFGIAEKTLSRMGCFLSLTIFIIVFIVEITGKGRPVKKAVDYEPTDTEIYNSKIFKRLLSRIQELESKVSRLEAQLVKKEQQIRIITNQRIEYGLFLEGLLYLERKDEIVIYFKINNGRSRPDFQPTNISDLYRKLVRVDKSKIVS